MRNEVYNLDTIRGARIGFKSPEELLDIVNWFSGIGVLRHKEFNELPEGPFDSQGIPHCVYVDDIELLRLSPYAFDSNVGPVFTFPQIKERYYQIPQKWCIDMREGVNSAFKEKFKDWFRGKIEATKDYPMNNRYYGFGLRSDEYPLHYKVLPILYALEVIQWHEVENKRDLSIIEEIETISISQEDENLRKHFYHNPLNEETHSSSGRDQSSAIIDEDLAVNVKSDFEEPIKYYPTITISIDGKDVEYIPKLKSPDKLVKISASIIMSSPSKEVAFETFETLQNMAACMGITVEAQSSNEQCKTPCGMNYCDENGCIDRVRHMVSENPILERTNDNTGDNAGKG